MKRYIYLFLILAAALHVAAAEIYVVDETGWSTLNLYSYIDNHDAIHGKWPGASAKRTETINGVQCPVFSFDIPSAGAYFLIFNNGSGAQTKDFAATENRDYYLIVTTTGCTEIKREDIKPQPLPEPTPANDWVAYQANEKIFARSKSFVAIDIRLNEIEALGVNVLWLMPIHPIGQKNAVNSPYCIKDFKGINTAFGTLDDLKTLVNHAHAKNMKVILDWVANHSALDHPWMTAHPDWYGTPSGDEVNWKDVQPFNFNNKDMRAAMIDAMTYWLKEADIDGFRCDYAQGVPDDFWSEAISAIRAIKPEAIMLAESSRTQLYTAGFDWMYSWNYLGSVQKIYNSNNGPSSLYNTSDKELSSTPSGKERLRYITNHDASSETANSDAYKSEEGMLAAACFTYFLAGVPLIYSSQEIGYLNKIPFCVPSSSSVLMNWANGATSVAAYQKMMQAYHATVLLRGGKQTRYTTNAKVGCFTYESQAGTLLVAVNLSDQNQTLAAPGALAGKTMQNLLTDGDETVPTTLSLPPYGYKLLAEVVPTAIEQVRAPQVGTKRLENGQIVIIRDNLKFNIFGLKL